MKTKTSKPNHTNHMRPNYEPTNAVTARLRVDFGFTLQVNAEEPQRYAGSYEFSMTAERIEYAVQSVTATLAGVLQKAAAAAKVLSSGATAPYNTPTPAHGPVGAKFEHGPDGQTKTAAKVPRRAYAHVE